ncbi:cytochrome P450 2F3-like [Lytechinus pictus]|uniref:cytochrome P450 2F3-like n=1 Tax=Lytechinus pictus TaxID=7653 RepID=UPI0030B9DDC6
MADFAISSLLGTPSLSVLFAAVVLLLVYSWIGPRTGLRHPPGPPGLPFLGSVFTLLFSKLQQHELLFKWSGEYGGIFSFTLAGGRVVVLSDKELIQETLQDPYVNDRIPFPACITIYGRENTGIAFASGPVWKEQQRFFLTVFRKVNASVIKFEDIIQAQGLRLLDELEKQEGQPFDPSDLVMVTISNVILKIVAGRTYEYDDPTLLRMATCSNRLADIIGPAGLFGMIPGLVSLPLPAKRQLTDLMREMVGFIKEHVDEHKANFVPEVLPTDFMSCYLKEIADSSENPETTFDDTNMLQTCWDAMFPGYETTISAFRWALHLLAGHPDVQSRIRHEIFDVVGRDRLPGYGDRQRMPYMESTVVECLRLRPVIPYVAPHIVSRDSKIAGYDVKVGTRVTVNLWFLARSPTLWEDPDEFKPERFLDDEGSYDRSREPLPFSYGRRTCPGDQLARMELFLILSYVLQRFTLTLPEGAPRDHGGSMGATFRPNQYELRATKIPPSAVTSKPE